MPLLILYVGMLFGGFCSAVSQQHEIDREAAKVAKAVKAEHREHKADPFSDGVRP